MKATIVLIGDIEAQNFGAKTMLKAHRIGGTGFESARLPYHVSLKQTFFLKDFDKFEQFFDAFAETVSPVNVPFEGLSLLPNNSIGGVPSGCLALWGTRTEELDELQKRFFRALEEAFGPCPAEHDHDYVFHMTLAIGKAPYENYLPAYEKLKEEPVPASLRFDKLGFFYYDDDAISAGTYFCYKTHELKEKRG